MNTVFLRKVFERMHGRTLASVIAEASQGTDGQVCEKTVRNWFQNRTTPDTETLKLLVAGGRQNLQKKLEKQAWPAALIPNGKGGFALTVALDVEIAGMDQATAESIVAEAHEVCPYSNAVKGNIDVQLKVTAQ